jgi:MFS family permease
MSVASVALHGASSAYQSTVVLLRRRVGGAARLHVVAVLAFVLGLDSADAGAIGSAELQIERGLHISTTDIGILLAVSSGVAALATVPAGALVDRVNRVRLLAGAVIVWSIATAAAAVAFDFRMLLLTQVVVGLATAVAGPATASLVGDYFPEDERGRIWGWVISGELLGAGVGLVLCGGLAAVSWRAAFAALALPAAGVVVLLLRTPEPARGGRSRLRLGARDFADVAEEPVVATQPAQPAARIPFLRAIRYVLTVRTNLVLIVVSALGYFFFSGARGFAMTFVKEQYGVNQFLATLLIPVIGGGGLIGVLIAARLTDRVAPRRNRIGSGRVALAGIAMTASAVVLAPATLVSGLGAGLLLLLVGGALVGAQNPPIDAARLDIVPAALWGRAEGVRTLLKSGATALAPIVFGLVADHACGGGLPGLRTAFLVTLIPLLAGGVVLLTIGRRHYPQDVLAATTAGAAADALTDRIDSPRASC